MNLFDKKKKNEIRAEHENLLAQHEILGAQNNQNLKHIIDKFEGQNALLQNKNSMLEAQAKSLNEEHEVSF